MRRIALAVVLALASGCVASRPATERPAAGVDDRTKLADEALTLDGTKAATPRVVKLLQATLTRSLSSGPDDELRFAPIIAASLRADSFYTAVVARVANGYDRERLTRTISWLRQPLAQKFVQLERDAIDAPPEDVERHARDSAASADHAERVALMARLERAEGMARFQADVFSALKRGSVKVTNRLVTPERRITPEEIERDRRAILATAEATIPNEMLFTYRRASIAELQQYVRFEESAEGQWYLDLVRVAILDAVETGAERATETLVKALLQGLPPLERT